MGASTLLLTAAQVRLQEGATPGAYRRSLRLAGTMLAQALPLVVFLFLFLPRPHGEFRISLGPSRLSSTGMSDHLQPGSIAALALRNEVAFHAKFPDGNAPPAPERYWRGTVLWSGNGLAWETRDRGRALSNAAPAAAPRRAAGPAADHPRAPRRRSGSLRSTAPCARRPRPISFPAAISAAAAPVMRRMTYDVVSQTTNDDRALPPDQLQAARQLPAHVSPSRAGARRFLSRRRAPMNGGGPARAELFSQRRLYLFHRAGHLQLE